MKNIFLGTVLFCSLSSFAQQPHCHTSEYIQFQKEQDPSYQLLLDAAQKKYEAYVQAKAEGKISGGDEIITIPVVVHIVWNIEVENISDEQVFSQIEVLNEDYRRLNEDAEDTPTDFADDADDPKIEFVLASFDENGEPTTGITRTETDIASWNLFAPATSANYAENVKSTDDGGEDGWERDCYLNIWVADLGASILGYASPPGGLSSKDGVVIGYKWFGRDGSAISPYDKGRTATHEVGHWLGLAHIWGDDGGECSGSDFIADTPNQTDENYGCPTFPLTDACSPTAPGVMFMNYMDYSDDECLNMFTTGQSNKMRDILESTREEILTCQLAYTSPIQTVDKEHFAMQVFPNPAKDMIEINFGKQIQEPLHFTMYSIQGAIVSSQIIVEGNNIISIDVSNLTEGVYLITASGETVSATHQIVITR